MRAPPSPRVFYAGLYFCLNKLMTSKEIRKKFLDFFQTRGHSVVQSSSLLPDDPSVLLTTAGMQQFKPYYTGQADPVKDFGSQNTVSVQKCFRTSDIDEVGDESHNTFFEMLGNFSFGGYFKKEAIQYAHEFITKEMKLDIDYVTVFSGDDDVAEDKESEKIWKNLGISEVKKLGRGENFWGPTGSEGPCGPTSEIYIKGVVSEIWNLVFNEYYSKDGKLTALKTKGVDTGMGLERLTMAVQGKKNIFETDLFAALLELLPQELSAKNKRIIVDHLRGSAFLIADGVRPANKEAGYILRRLLRRVFVYEYREKLPDHLLNAILHDIVHEYGEFYPGLLAAGDVIREEVKKEKEKFMKTLSSGINALEKIEIIDSASAFKLFETYGIPYEIIKEFGRERAVSLDRDNFELEFKKHQEISRSGAEKKFGGHGLILDTGELKASNEEELKKVTRLHTATHLLQAALRKVLGDTVSQKGSDITAERTRFDFAFPRKLTDEEIKEIEDIVNNAIAHKYSVSFEEMPLEEAKKTGALFFFKEKYPPTVKVYYVGHSLDTAFSKEFCGGPHVKNTSEIGHFKILKQESTGSDTRRIRATVL